jgi:hypothetical protein
MGRLSRHGKRTVLEDERHAHADTDPEKPCPQKVSS